MARKLIVSIIADASKFIAGMEMSSKAVNGFGADVEKVAVSTELAAKAQVAAAIKTTESLKAESAAYHQLAAAAVKGSQEQVAAANLAAAADRKLAASMGIAGAETATLRGHTTGLGRDMEKASRGVISGSGALHGFGRSLAFASGGFLAFEGVSKFLTDSIGAARDAGVAQRSLAAQMKSSGESFAANQGAIEKASLSLEKFGFTSEDSQKALAVLDRATGNVGKSIQLQGVAANIARARNISLSQAALILGKAYDGQTTSLKRLGVALPQGAKGMQAIYIAAQKFSGQAKANTTDVEKFHAALHDTEVILGEALLPAMNQFLEALTKWLQKMNESGRLQRDVNEAVKIATGLFDAAKTALDDLNKITGSTKDTLELLLGAFAAFKVAGILSWFTKLTGSIGGVEAASKTAAGAEGLGGLESTLSGLTAAPWMITILVAYKDIKDPGSILDRAKALFGFVKKGGPLEQALENLPSIGPVLKAAHQGISAFGGAGGAGGGGDGGLPPGLGGPLGAQSGLPGPTGPLGSSRLKIPGGIYGNTAAPLTAAQQRAIGLAADPNNLKLLRAQAAHDQAAIEFAQKLRTTGRISNQKYVQEVTAYASDLQQTNSTIAGILQAAHQKTIDATAAAAQKAAAAAQKLREQQQAVIDAFQVPLARADLTKTPNDNIAVLQAMNAKLEQQNKLYGVTKDRMLQIIANQQTIQGYQQQIADQQKTTRENRQFAALGLGPGGAELVPTAQALRKRLGRLEDAVTGTFLDTTKTNQLFNRIQRVLTGHFGTLTESIRSQIKQMLDTVSQQFDQKPAAKKQRHNLFTQLGLTATGLPVTTIYNRADYQRLRRTWNPSMGALRFGHGSGTDFNPALTRNVTINGGVHVHGITNPRKFVDDLEKMQRGKPHTRRGSG